MDNEYNESFVSETDEIIWGVWGSICDFDFEGEDRENLNAESAKDHSTIELSDDSKGKEN